MIEYKKYLKPPLVEAVFELFYRTTEWSPIIPGIFYNEIRNSFPVITSSQSGFGISIDPSGLMIGGQNNDLTQYKSDDGKTLVQLSGTLLTVNKLPEYVNWESYKQTIDNTINALRKTYKKFEINRIGLRFINKIDIGDTHSLTNLKKYFDVYPVIPTNITKELDSIQISVESHLIKDTEILAIALTTVKKEPKYNSPVLFQLYVTRIKDISGIKIEEWIDNAHQELINTFENSVTELCKKEFDNVKL